MARNGTVFYIAFIIQLEPTTSSLRFVRLGNCSTQDCAAFFAPAIRGASITGAAYAQKPRRTIQHCICTCLPNEKRYRYGTRESVPRFTESSFLSHQYGMSLVLLVAYRRWRSMKPAEMASRNVSPPTISSREYTAGDDAGVYGRETARVCRTNVVRPNPSRFCPRERNVPWTENFMYCSGRAQECVDQTPRDESQKYDENAFIIIPVREGESHGV